MTRGVEVGNIFKLGTRYSDSLGCTFQDKDGQSKPIIMGSYGIGIGRLLACVAEENHDDQYRCYRQHGNMRLRHSSQTGVPTRASHALCSQKEHG